MVEADPARVANEELRVHLCGPGDREEQARLFAACFKKPCGAESLAWRYDASPHGAAVSLLARPPRPADAAEGTGLQGTGPEGAFADGISGYACSPRLAVAHGEPGTLAPVGQTGDVMTHPAWRKRGIFSDLDRAALAETARLGWPVVFGLPNRRSAHIFLQLGWERVGTIRPWTLVLRADAAARRARLADGRLAAWATPLAARAARRARARLEREGAALEARDLERFPPAVKLVAREVEPRFALMVRRDAAYLDWRFLRAPAGRFEALGVFRPGGALRGYVVVQRPHEGVGHLVDLLAIDAEAESAALAAGLGRLAQRGASAVRATAIDGSWWRERLASAGFRPPKPDNHLIVIRHVHEREHPLARASADARAWYLTDGDRDDETVG